MSIQGRSSLSYKKQNVTEQKIPHTGVKNIVFAHEFVSVGEDAILFNSLNTPTPWTESGLQNPSGASLLSANLQAFKSNVEVTSSARGYIQKSEYIVKNNGIYFKNITSLANEVFEVKVSDILVTGQLVVDTRRIRVEGELLDGTTNFVIGNEVDVYDEDIVVFRDGAQMFRSDDNDPSGTTGNYYYVDTTGNGKSSEISFFEPASGDEPILISSMGNIVDSPNTSTFQQIEYLAGQLDAVVPTVAALAGVPETNFRTGPNNVDLRQFGSKVIEHEIDIDALEAKVDTGLETVTEYVETTTKVKWQRKSFVGPSSTDGIKIQFNNLEIGKTYRISGNASILENDGTTQQVTFYNGSNSIMSIKYDGYSTANEGIDAGNLEIFTATDATFTVEAENFASQPGRILYYVNATLEELPNHEVTTQWT
jgi:hypothetical protein